MYRLSKCNKKQIAMDCFATVKNKNEIKKKKEIINYLNNMQIFN